MHKKISRRYFILSKDGVHTPFHTVNDYVFHVDVPRLPAELQDDARTLMMMSFESRCTELGYKCVQNCWHAPKGVQLCLKDGIWHVKCVAKHSLGTRTTVSFEAGPNKAEACDLFWDHWNPHIERKFAAFGLHTHIYHEVPGKGRYPEVKEFS